MTCMYSFVTDESGAVSLDWVVLTAVIVGTGASIIGSLDSGFGTTNPDEAAALRGQVVEQSFSLDMCNHGIEGLKAREAARAVNGRLSNGDVELRTGRTAFERQRFAEAAARRGNVGQTGDASADALVACDTDTIARE